MKKVLAWYDDQWMIPMIPGDMIVFAEFFVLLRKWMHAVYFLLNESELRKRPNQRPNRLLTLTLS